MKKLVLIAVLAVSAAFAHSGDHKHMVRFSGFDDAGFSDTFDVSFGTQKQDAEPEDNDGSVSNIALNYAYNINGAWQVGGTFKNNNDENGLDTRTVGLSGYYNMAGKVVDTCYVGLHYNMTTEEAANTSDLTNTNDIVLEYGHRFSVGSAMGLHLTFAPSVSYTMGTTTYDNDAEDKKTTELAWNFVKFDVLF